MSQLTTHVLDTTKGKPAVGLHLVLCHYKNRKWVDVAKGTTDADGRVTDLLKKNAVMELGTYKLHFESQAYFARQSVQTFYPFVEIIFLVTTEDHYHVPLLLSPYSYSTYRGS